MGLIRRPSPGKRGNIKGQRRLVVIASGVFCIGTFTFFPILVLENVSHRHNTNHNNDNNVSLSKNNNANQQQQAFNRISVDHAVRGGNGPTRTTTTKRQQQNPMVNTDGGVVVVEQVDTTTMKKPSEGAPAMENESSGAIDSAGGTTNNTTKTRTTTTTRITKDGRILPIFTLKDLETDEKKIDRSKIGRGVSAVINPSPLLAEAQRAHVDCDINVDSLAYWNVGEKQPSVANPFKSDGYITFAPDNGGWNNVRMSMEIIFVIAAATSRTLVLPPREPMYLLHLDKDSRYRGFADFFPIHTAAFQNRVKVITFEEFLTTEMAPTNDPALMQTLQASSDHCDKRAKSDNPCTPIFEWLKSASFNSEISATHTCLVFDEEMYHQTSSDGSPKNNVTTDIQDVCGTHREITFWNAELAQHKWIHFRASENEYRLLTHFYNLIHFSNPMYDHIYKRFVRDALHYHDSIYCAAGKIVKAIQREGKDRGFLPDANGAGGYSALHVRRGDLQYKKVKIPASEWYENTKEVWQPREILYIATDERNKTFFDDLQKHHDLRFLDDYWDLAGLSELDPNYMGMIDTVIASRGRAFAGTWFSTFSGYINRLRGYHGLSMMDSWYSFLPKKTAVHEWNTVDDFAYAYEWPDGWVGIDGDEFPNRETF